MALLDGSPEDPKVLVQLSYIESLAGGSATHKVSADGGVNPSGRRWVVSSSIAQATR